MSHEVFVAGGTGYVGRHGICNACSHDASQCDGNRKLHSARRELIRFIVQAIALLDLPHRTDQW